MAWKIKVLNYDEENGELMSEIVDYFAKPEVNIGKQISLQFQPIDKIKFRSLDTTRLLNAVELKRIPIAPKLSEETVSYDFSKPTIKAEVKPIEIVLKKTLKILSLVFNF